MPDDAKALVRRIGEFEEEQGDLLAGPILWMNGTDHLMPQPWLGRVVAEANALDAGYELHICSLAEHVRSAPTEGLPVVDRRAALRGAREPADGGGLQPRRCEAGRRRRRAGARAAGRATVGAVPPGREWPGALLDEAWLEVIRNSAHDSICACSVDEVCDAVLHRFAEATQIADGLTDRALEALGATVPVDGRTPVVVNPSARTRGGLVELRLPGADLPPGTQLVSSRPAEWVMLDATPADTATVTVSELEYVRNVRSFTVEALDGTELSRRARGSRHARDPAHPTGAGGDASRARRAVGAGPRRRRGRR